MIAGEFFIPYVAHILFLVNVLKEKAMAPHSSTLAWKIPWMEEPGRLQSMGSRRVRHDWVTSLSPFTFMHWRRQWQSTPVFLPGESQGWESLVGCHLCGHTESDMTEATSQQQQQMGPDAMTLVFWMLSFKPTFSLFSFTFIKRFFSSSSLSAIRVVSSAYLRWLIFLPAILIPACASSRQHFSWCILHIS